ncbi:MULTISPECIES: PqiC family protein [unclassified Pseudomonas]|uniref:PqiC family protein n=1 Tax=unclassified Pseudomonas TaxID=196821 RepID=UPI002B22B963|nr:MULTISPECIES: PqiC family protein [unclassified Pseudomonas]MEA9976839.1 PqiC family protein [Pseudomonas sp. RTS4]MEB0196819.1 PqiC family protein [Pseudomonas sp. 5S4]MEB0244278.1 PqiC family protein [Pseudomonas sp. 10S5]
MKSRLFALFASLGLAACVSAPTHYYTLVPTANDARPSNGAPAFQFEMQPVLIPVQVDQPQVVVRLSSGALSILETERWSAPLADEFHDSLANQMELRLGTRNLEGLPKVPGRPVISLQTDVRRFDSIPGQYALIDVVWSISRRLDTEQRRSLTCSSTLRQPAGIQVQDVVMAHQQVIAQLAAIIAVTARKWAQDPGVGCP